MNEKDVHRNLPSVRDNRSQNQLLKQSFQTFADESKHLTSQPHRSTVGKNNSFRSDCERNVLLSAVSLDDGVIDPWVQAARIGRVVVAEACCTSDSLLSGAVTSHGGRAVQYSRWNGFDLTSKARTEKI